ncbi:hypothetical protein [Paucibacter sp. XJ19-41]|uniref:hypothetical protein n=1 Tax=Paucibacter sp. XJ19-41 TaxID=2927824 RepID=UPI00234B3513|nr:hypothetical protein [Paucibacter sp. XJ19-41]MDC6166025.1 hypothetical protein [Paucibacter sp. XJ19-41]
MNSETENERIVATLVEPHPLDSDWRFCTSSIQRISSLIGTQSCILLGMPSVARQLESQRSRILLIDRQPLQLVKSHIYLDPSFDSPPDLTFDCAALDPPWYPEIFLRWLAWAAQTVGNRGTIICTLWPIDTRPSAEQERWGLLSWLESWSDVTIITEAVAYETPFFELQASAPLGRTHPRLGDLLLIRKRKPIPLAPPLMMRELWYRFSFRSYQLAIRHQQASSGKEGIKHHPLANNWLWKSVSRRAKGIEAIDIWSSRNEVGIVNGAVKLINLLQSKNISSINIRKELENTNFLSLLEWKIMDTPFEDVFQWKHRA